MTESLLLLWSSVNSVVTILEGKLYRQLWAFDFFFFKFGHHVRHAGS